MNLLVIHHSYNVFENYLFFLIYTAQNLSIFISKSASNLDYNNYSIDKILVTIGKILRVKSYLYNYRKYYNLFIYFLASYYIIFTIFFITLIYKTSRKTAYTLNLLFLNFLIKMNFYVLNNINIDFFTRMLCFGSSNNRYIQEIKCNQSNNYIPLIISGFSTVYSSFLTLFIQMYYEENLFISDSKFNTITSKIYIYQHLISIIASVELSLISQLTKELFFITNITMSVFLFYYYIKRLIYYNIQTNMIFGSTYFLNVYSSIFFFTFHFFHCSNKGLIYILSSIFIVSLFSIIFNNIINKIVRKTPYHKIYNGYFLLFYIKQIIDLTNLSQENQEAKSLLRAIIEMHAIECPNKDCLTKNKNKIYLPAKQEWSYRDINPISDQIFLKNFIPIILKYFISISHFSPELLMNLSYYYLAVIGNQCLSLYYYNRAKNMKLNIEEKFLLVRLKILISEKINEGFKKGYENCPEFEQMNPTLYFKYKHISEQFIEQMEKDLDLNIEFWENFSKQKNQGVLKFKNIFNVIQKIEESKIIISNLWEDLFQIYSGINPVFMIYLEFITDINDDINLKKKLEAYKKKKEISTESILTNYYSILFHKETGLVIVNGENGKEGLIESADYKFGLIFNITIDKIKGESIHDFMPKIFSNEHSKFMRDYYQIGEKKVIDKGQYKTFGIDKNKNIIQIHISLKLFPVLNHHILYIAMINMDKVDDVIILDSNFIIQGMSKKLNKYFQIDNPNLFNYNEIPFYMICKNFISFYKTFFKNKKQKESYLSSTFEYLDETEYQYLLNEEKEKDEKKNEAKRNSFLENIEINENMEIQYHIKFPEFLSHYSYYTNHLQHEHHDSSTSVNDIVLKNTKSGQLALKEEENSNLIHKKETHKASHASSQELVAISHTTTNQPLSPVHKKKKLINFQINGVKYIYLYKSLFNQGKFDELENLFDENTSSNYISLKFNFSFERFHFGDHNHYYIIRCSDDHKKTDNKPISNIHPQNKVSIHDIIRDNKIKYLYELNNIVDEEKKILEDNISNFRDLLSTNNDFRKLINEKIKEINDKSRIIGEHNEKNRHEHSQLQGESSSQTSHSSFVNHLSKLNKITEGRNKILNKKYTSFMIKYLKILPLFLIIELIIFKIVYDIFFQNTKKELLFVRHYNNLVFSVQITLIIILNRVVDYAVLYYSNLYEYGLDLRFGYNDTVSYEIEIRRNVSRWYSESNKNIIFLERYISKYVKDTKKRIWINIQYPYDNDIPFNNSAFFPILTKNSLYDAYNLFTIDNLFTTPNYNIKSDIFEMVNYSYKNSVKGLINFLLPQLINNLNNLIEDYLQFSNEQFYKFEFLILIYLIICFTIFIVSFLFTGIIIKELNYGLNKISKISQDEIEGIILNVQRFRINLKLKSYKYHLKKINHLKDDYENEQLKNEIETKFSKQILEKKKEFKTSMSIINNIYYKKTNHRKISFPYFILFIYSMSLLLIIIFLCFLFYFPKNLINNNSNLIKSHSFFLERFLYVTASVFKIKAIFAQFVDVFSLDLSNVINNSLLTNLYETLPKFKEFYDFYYYSFMLDACKALHDFDSDDYKKCDSQYFPHLVNNTDSLRDYLIKKIEDITYTYESKVSNDPNFNSYTMFTMKEYTHILYSYTNYYIPVHSRFDLILKRSFENKAKNIKFYIDFLFVFIFCWFIANLLYQYIIYIPLFEKMFVISRNFIKVIPCSIILNTPELEKWLEKAEHQ